MNMITTTHRQGLILVSGRVIELQMFISVGNVKKLNVIYPTGDDKINISGIHYYSNLLCVDLWMAVREEAL